MFFKKMASKKSFLWYLFCLLIAFVFLLFTSKNSFLYTFNDWVDANAFFTVGKSMFHGVVPYRDLFEQKGPLLYVIYGIGSIFSSTSFHGVFLLEVISFSIFLYYCHKIVSLFLNKKYSFLILPIFTLIITTSSSFVHGGSAEEFCFPMFSISLYYFFKYFMEKELSKKEFLLNGLMAGFVFMIKYTMLGFWIGFMFFILLKYLIDKKYKKIFSSSIFFLIGMFTPFLIFTIYFLLNGAFKDFIECYFVVNITCYGSESISLLERLSEIYSSFWEYLFHTNIFFTVLVIIYCIFFFVKKRYFLKISLLGLILFTVLGCYWGLIFYSYYSLPFSVFFLFPFIAIFYFIQKIISPFFENKKILMSLIYGMVFLGCLFLTYENTNYKEMILLPKKNYFQFEFADIINQSEDQSLVNIGFLDAGLYTTANVIPSTYYFELQNLDYERYPYNRDAFVEYIENSTTEFILYYGNYSSGLYESVKNMYPLLFENYVLVMESKQVLEGETFQAYLFQRRK